MKEYINKYTIANELRMKRSSHFGSFLVVDTDVGAKVFKRFINEKDCQIILAHNKENAIGALNIIEHDAVKGVLTVVNANFWKLQEEKPSSKNLFVTDSHDIETMLIQSPAFEKLLSVSDPEDKITFFTEQHNKDMRAVLLESSVMIGCLRWVSDLEKLALEFEGINFNDFVNEENLVIDERKLVQAIKSHSARYDIEDEVLLEKINLQREKTHDLWQICCGHDLLHILSIGLCKVIGSHDITGIEKGLILAYEQLDFYQTQLCLSLFQWEVSNKPFNILSDTIKSLIISTSKLLFLAVEKLESLIKSDAKESDFQVLLTENTWMFGSSYCQLLDRRDWVLGEQQDFMVKRTIDGYLELIEIKTPLNGKPLFLKDPSHNNFYPRSELSQVVAQVTNYLANLDADHYRILATTREDVSKINAKIIIGRSLDENQIKEIRKYNAHMHRIEILTFDQLLLVARQILTYPNKQ